MSNVFRLKIDQQYTQVIKTFLIHLKFTVKLLV